MSHSAEGVQWDSSEMKTALIKQRATFKKCPHMDQHFTKSKLTGAPHVQETLQDQSRKLICDNQENISVCSCGNENSFWSYQRFLRG